MAKQPRQRKPIFLSLVLTILCVTAFYHAYLANAQLTPILPPLAAHKNLMHWLQQTPEKLMTPEPLYHLETVSEVYQRTDYRLLWLENYGLSKTGKQLVQHLQETSADELLDYNYHLTYIQQRLHQLPTLPREATALDILLTDAFVSYADDVLSDKLLLDINPGDHVSRRATLGGGLKPVAYQASIDDTERADDNRHRDIIQLLTDNHSVRKLSRVLTSMKPAHDDYQRLRSALEHYRQLLNSNDWHPIDKGPSLRVGDTHPHAAQLRRLLSLYKDYPLPQSPSLLNLFNGQSSIEQPKAVAYFDSDLQASLKHFQQRHGKPPSGILGRKTRALLNVPPSYRIRQLSLNMKRWRQLPNQLGERYIWVNMTDYRLQLMEDGDPSLEMKVIIGKSYRRTPVMQESISTLVLNPHWNVPRRIALYDLLPQIRKDPNYLSEHRINLYENWDSVESVSPELIDWSSVTARNFPYRMQQEAGQGNALGMVKFIIPNDMSIYLHDTNHPGLFERDFRALSSGCVRVEKPLELAMALLKGKRGWDDEQLASVLDEGETTYLRLPEPVPTYLMYWTAWVDDQGILQYRDDIYSRDQLEKTQQLDLDTLIL